MTMLRNAQGFPSQSAIFDSITTLIVHNQPWNHTNSAMWDIESSVEAALRSDTREGAIRGVLTLYRRIQNDRILSSVIEDTTGEEWDRLHSQPE